MNREEILTLANRLRRLHEEGDDNTETFKNGAVTLTDLIIEYFER